MSNRFYVNDFQIFGNNEMFQRTYEELKRQGANWTDDGTFDAIEIKDPQGLMRAVELDTFVSLKKWATEDVIDKVNKKYYKHRDFSEVHDKELFFSSFEDEWKCMLYDENGEVERNTWHTLEMQLSTMRMFTPYFLYQAIKKDVDYTKDGFVLKEGHTITARMY
jgi:hypothetical protein